MAAEAQQSRFDQEIAQIENRAGTRRMFLIIIVVSAILLLAIIAFGARERVRIAREAARAKTEEVVLGSYVGTASNQAVFARDNGLVYLEGVGEAEIGSTTTFVRMLEYDAAGNPVALEGEMRYWRLESSDSLPYVIEPIASPLIGISPSQFREIDLNALSPSAYGAGGPGDWRMQEQERADVRVTGTASRANGSVVLSAGTGRVRVQGIEGLSPLDSLEVAWATQNGAPLTAFGTISSSPRTADALFVLTAEAVHPPDAVTEEESAAEGAPPAPPDTAAPTTP
jgi:hypothetical protein